MEYTFQDIAFRFGGAGSLGRARYALLFNKEKQKADLSTLRLIEWKDSLDSSLDSSEPRFSHDRAQQGFDFTRSFQLLPKRYLGYAMLGEPPYACERDRRERCKIQSEVDAGSGALSNRRRRSSQDYR